MYVRGMWALCDFPGHVVYEVSVAPHIAEVKVRPDRRRTLRCGACGGRMTACRTLPQFARDLALGPMPMVLIRYQAVQGHCRRCRRYRTVRPPGIEPRRGATSRLMRYVAAVPIHTDQACRGAAPVSETVIRRWGRAVLLVDEKSIGSHHQYASVVTYDETGELLHMAESK